MDIMNMLYYLMIGYLTKCILIAVILPKGANLFL